MKSQTEDATSRAAVYVRVSSSQQEQDGTSLESQEERCRRYAADRGLVIDDAQVYREVYSGAVLHERPWLAALRDAARSGQFSVVICYAVDRLARNQAPLYILAEELERNGIRLEFVTEDFEDSAVGKFIRSAKAFAAEVEREKFRERSMRGKLARVQAGKLMHGKTPLYGYAWTDDSKGRLAIDPVTAGVVRRIFTEAANGRPLRSIARALDEDGILTPRGAKVWDFVAIGRLLHNPAYVGEAYAFRQRYERVPGASRSRRIHLPPEQWTRLPDGTIPPIVSRELFEAVQARLAINKQRSPRRTIDREAYLLRGGFVRCGYCGYMMVIHHKLRTVAYTCTKRSRSTGSCTHHCISTRILDASVWARVQSVLTQPEVIAA